MGLSIETQNTTVHEHYPLRGLWHAARRSLHRNCSISVFVCNEQGHYDRVTTARDEKELRLIWDSLVLSAVQAGREVRITDIGSLMVD